MSIPQLFTCPISLELLNDPVTLSTGHTYDRPCIEKWLTLGNTTCPISMQKLHDFSMVPNHTLKHFIHQWLQSSHNNQHDGFNDGINSFKNRLEGKDTTYDQKILALEQVRCLLLEGDLESKRQGLIQMGLFPLVVGLVFGAKFSQDMTCLVEKSLACVLRLMGFCSLGHLNVLLEAPNFENFITLLQQGTSSMIKIRLCEVIEAIFLSPSLEIQGLATKIGNETKVLKSLITCIDQCQQNHQVSNGGIKAILGMLLSSSSKGEYRENLVKQGLIHSLVGYILVVGKQEKNLAPKATRALELALELQSGKEMFLGEGVPNGVKALVGMVFRVSSDEEGSQSALNSLMILCCESKQVRDEAICGGVLTQLLLLLQSQCSGRTKTRARMLLKLLTTMWG